MFYLFLRCDTVLSRGVYYGESMGYILKFPIMLHKLLVTRPLKAPTTTFRWSFSTTLRWSISNHIPVVQTHITTCQHLASRQALVNKGSLQPKNTGIWRLQEPGKPQQSLHSHRKANGLARRCSTLQAQKSQNDQRNQEDNHN